MSQAAPADAQRGVILLKPRGFCAGVVRAIDVVKIALIFVDELSDVPEGMRVIFSAHGVSPAVRDAAKARNLKVIDATCPLVTKVHIEAVKFARKGFTIVLIGHKDHDEVEGTLGEAPDSTVLVENVADVDKLEIKDPSKVAYITQTTLSLDETVDIVNRLQERFPLIQGPHAQDICYATENRQIAVKAVVPMCDLLLVVGSQNSSNSRRLVEVCQQGGVASYLIDDHREVKAEWLAVARNVAVTAGASAPENLVQDLISYLQEQGFTNLQEMEIREEDVRFSLPSGLDPSALVKLTPMVLSSSAAQ
jgi:4-hydroxy-3-methylbut-2-en-1-yl diphosphate reductase